MVRIDNRTPVVILKSKEYNGLGILRSLGSLGVPIYIVNADEHVPAVLSRYCRQKFVCDIGEFTWKSSADLLNIGRRIGRRSILIPTSDDGAVFVANNADALREWFIFPAPGATLVHSLCSKKQMYHLAKRFGVPTPETAFPQSKEDVVEFLEGASFPIMLKAIHSWLMARGKENNVIVHTKSELLEKYDAMENLKEPNLMVQEYVPGGDDSVWMFNGYFNESSDCLLGFTGRKIRQWPPHRGVATLGVCARNEAVEERTKEFMKAIGYRGVLDIGYRYDARDGRYKVFDVNPRIGCTFRLFVADNGMDVARALYLDMTGQPIAPGIAPEGRKWFVEDLDLASALHSFRDEDLSFKEWIESLRGIREGAYFSLADPLPLLRRLKQILGLVLG
jgi:predicted ATP-grasp superfamily ATP-dependent carboligase